jgi:hypothetical protein
VRFMAVLMWIGVAFMLLGAAGLVVMGSIGGSVGAQLKNSGAFGGAPLMAIAIVYGLMALIYIYPAVKLWAFANRIGSLAATRSVSDLDAALTQQRQFWKFLGVMMILMMCAYVVIIIGFVAYGASAAMKGGMIPR